MAKHFAQTLKLQLLRENVKASGKFSVQLSTATISTTDPALQRSTAKSPSGSAAHLAKHASNVKTMLYGVLGAVGLAYAVLGVCMYRKNQSKQRNSGRQMDDYEEE